MRRISENQRAAAERRLQLLAQERSLTDEQRAALARDVRTCDGAELSPRNVALVVLQATAAGFTPSEVGGFRQWTERGRVVRKGARGLLIAFPKMGKNEETGADKLTGFGWGYVFDISQTAAAGKVEEERPEVATVSDSAPVAAAAASVPASAPDDDLAAVLAAIASA